MPSGYGLDVGLFGSSSSSTLSHSGHHHGIVKQPGVGEQTVSHVVVLPWRGAWVGARRPPAIRPAL
ncbi:hypothetical protein FA13DRAFT_1736365, partial [Coprinellus micaceus]